MKPCRGGKKLRERGGFSTEMATLHRWEETKAWGRRGSLPKRQPCTGLRKFPVIREVRIRGGHILFRRGNICTLLYSHTDKLGLTAGVCYTQLGGIIITQGEIVHSNILYLESTAI